MRVSGWASGHDDTDIRISARELAESTDDCCLVDRTSNRVEAVEHQHRRTAVAQITLDVDARQPWLPDSAEMIQVVEEVSVACLCRPPARIRVFWKVDQYGEEFG